MKKLAKKRLSLALAVSLSVLSMDYTLGASAQEIDLGDMIINERGADGADGGVGEAGGNGKEIYIDAEVSTDNDNLKLTAEKVSITANGGNGGAGAVGGDGGEAVIGSLRVRDGSNVQMDIPSYIVIANGGAGGEGTVGGTGGTVWAEGIALENLQGSNSLELNQIYVRAKAGSNGDGSTGDTRATAYAFEIDNAEKLTVTSAKKLSFEAQAYDGNSSSTAIALRMMGSNVDYNAKKHLGIYAVADIDDERDMTGSNYARKAESTGMMAVGGTSTINANSVAVSSTARISCAKDISGASAIARGIAASDQELNINADEITVAALADIGRNNIISKAQAEAMWLENSKVRLNAEERLAIAAWSFAFGDASVCKSTDVIGVYAYNSELDFNSGELIEIGTIKNYKTDEENVYALVGVNNSKISMKAAEEISITGDIALWNDSRLVLAADEENDGDIDINGDITLANGSLLKLQGNANVRKSDSSRSVPVTPVNGCNVNINDSALVIDGVTRVDGNVTLNNAKLYLFDAEQQANNDFHALVTNGSLNFVGEDNEIFLRADSSIASDIGNGVLNSDLLSASMINIDDKINVNIFDEGMKNGYNGGDMANPLLIFMSGTDTEELAAKININKTTYDNGIWKYEYDMEANSDADGNIVVNGVKNIATQASASQLTLHSANTAAAVGAVAVLGNDNALHEHLCEVHEDGAHEEVWAKYFGGKVQADGAQVKYNGVELGYDAYVGNDWTLGASGTQVRSNTQLDGGSGKVKTNVGTLYGQWHGDGGEYVNLVAKAGRMSSESKTTVLTGCEAVDYALQKLDDEFSAPAYSLSAEYGKKIALANGWFIEPTAKLSYVHMGANDYNVKLADTAAHIANDAFDSFAVRGGFKLGKNLGERGSFYVKAAAVYDFASDVATTVSADNRSERYEDSLGGWGVEYGAGVDYHLSKASKLTLDVERRSGGDLTRDWGVNVGVSYSF